MNKKNVITVIISMQCFSIGSIAEIPDIQSNTSVKLNSILVAGLKSSRDLQKTSGSIQVIDAERIQDEGIRDVYDVMDTTVNMGGRRELDFNIRGIGAFDIAGGGQGQLATVYVDDAPVPFRAAQLGAFSSWDIEQIEVLRGPQSTLLGANSLAGAVVVNSRDPDNEWQANSRFILGSYGRKEAALAVGGGREDGQLAFRLAAEKQQSDGFIKNPYRRENGNYYDKYNLRLKLAIAPDDIRGLKLRISHAVHHNEIGVPWQSSDSPHRYNKPRVYFNDLTRESVTTDRSTVKAEYQLAPGWQITAISAYTESRYRREWDGDSGPVLNDVYKSDRNDALFSQELRLNFETEKVSGIVGGFFSRLDIDDDYSGSVAQALQFLGISTDGIKDLLNKEIKADISDSQAQSLLQLYSPYDPMRRGLGGETDQSVDTQALFMDLTIKTTDQLDLLAGVRYDREQHKRAVQNQVLFSRSLPDANADLGAIDSQASTWVKHINQHILGTCGDSRTVGPKAGGKFSAWLPKLGLQYHFSDRLMSSFVVQRGYRSGGVDSNLHRGYSYRYKPEYTWNYEASFRSAWFDGRLTANANMFYLDWQDQQIGVNLSGSPTDREIRNAASSEAKGAELELAWFDGYRNAYLGIGHNKTRFNKFIDNGRDLSGRPFVAAAEWNIVAGGSLRSDDGWLVQANVDYLSSSNAKLNPDTFNVPKHLPAYDPKNDARTVVNVSAGYEWSTASLVLEIDNLTDEKYLMSADIGRGPESTGLRRNYALRLETRF